MTDEKLVRQSIDKLFEEPFEPLWMKWQKPDIDSDIKTDCDYRWLLAARQSRLRISEKFPPKMKI